MNATASIDNTVPIKAWDTVLFDKYCRFRSVLIQGFAPHSDHFLERRPYPAGARVLDVGCGFGDTTQRIARQVGPTGAAVGVDCARGFIEIGSREAREAALPNASYFVADVQTEDLRGPYDGAFSRFGTMFFNAPVAALRNIGKSMPSGGELTMIVWRRREDNPWVHEAELRVRSLVPVVSHEQTDAVHCGPGPFSMAGADTVSEMLRIAGFDRITLERFDTDIGIGRTPEEAIEFALALGPAGEIMRLAGTAGEERRGDVVAALRETFAPYVHADGVRMPSSSWFVTARCAE
jgi:ubiquinone/menaquinone biosynthesis C-methylase UbiE